MSMLGLKLPTDPRWVNLAEMDLAEILSDHAYCEQKAATFCISIIQQYPDFNFAKLTEWPRYFEKVFEANPDYYDYVNYGHVKWALGDRKSAIENYVLSSNYSNFSLGELHKIMEDDKALLLKNGVDADEVPLMMDFLRYSQK